MAKGKYEYWLTAEGLLQLGGWARNGLTDEHTTAQIFWLKNRKPEEWRDKRDVTVDGSVHSVVSSMSDEVLDERIASLKGKLGIHDE